MSNSKQFIVFVVLLMSHSLITAQHKPDIYKVHPGKNTRVVIDKYDINTVELVVTNNRDQRNANLLLNDAGDVLVSESNTNAYQVFLGYIGRNREFISPILIQADKGDNISVVKELYTKGALYFDAQDDLQIMFLTKNSIKERNWGNISEQLGNNDSINTVVILYGDKSDIKKIEKYCALPQTVLSSIENYLLGREKYQIVGNHGNSEKLNTKKENITSRTKANHGTAESSKKEKQKESAIGNSGDINKVVENSTIIGVKENKEKILVLRLVEKQNRYKNIFADNYHIYHKTIRNRLINDSTYSCLSTKNSFSGSKEKGTSQKLVNLDSVHNGFIVVSCIEFADTIVATISLKENKVKFLINDVTLNNTAIGIKGFNITAKYKDEILQSAVDRDTLLLPVENEYSIEVKHNYYFTVQPDRKYETERLETKVRLSDGKMISIPIYTRPKEGTLKVLCEMIGPFRGNDTPDYVYIVSKTGKRRVHVNEETSIKLLEKYDESFKIELGEENQNIFRITSNTYIPGLKWNRTENATVFKFTIERILTLKKLSIALTSELPNKAIPIQVSLSWDRNRERTTFVVRKNARYDTTIWWPNRSDTIILEAEKIPFYHYLLDDDWKAERLSKTIVWQPSQIIELKMSKQLPLNVVFIDVTKGMMSKNGIISSLSAMFSNVKAIKNNINDIVLFISNGIDRYYNVVNSEEYVSIIGRYEPLAPRFFDELKYLNMKIKSGQYGQKRIERSISVYLSASSVDLLLAMNKTEFITALNDANVDENDQYLFYIDEEKYHDVRNHINLRDELLFDRYPIKQININ